MEYIYEIIRKTFLNQNRIQSDYSINGDFNFISSDYFVQKKYYFDFRIRVLY